MFIEALLDMTRAHDNEERCKKERQRLHLITLISAAFKECDEDDVGTLDETEMPHLLELCQVLLI